MPRQKMRRISTVFAALQRMRGIALALAVLALLPSVSAYAEPTDPAGLRVWLVKFLSTPLDIAEMGASQGDAREAFEFLSKAIAEDVACQSAPKEAKVLDPESYKQIRKMAYPRIAGQ